MTCSTLMTEYFARLLPPGKAAPVCRGRVFLVGQCSMGWGVGLRLMLAPVLQRCAGV